MFSPPNYHLKSLVSGTKHNIFLSLPYPNTMGVNLDMGAKYLAIDILEIDKITIGTLLSIDRGEKKLGAKQAVSRLGPSIRFFPPQLV
jgi:hypothetical protein